MAKLTIEEIIASLKEMTVVELNDLVKAVEEEFGVTAAVAVAAAPAEEETVAAGPTEEVFIPPLLQKTYGGKLFTIEKG